MAGEIVHIEIPSGDFARSSAFYGKLFGWKTDGVQSGGHLLFDLPGGVRGSWIREALAQAPGPVPFVAVADVEGTLAEAERQGGRVLVRRLQLANRGFFGLIADRDGNVIGVLDGADAVHATTPAKAAAAPAPKAKPETEAKAETKTETKTDQKAAAKPVAKPVRAAAPPAKSSSKPVSRKR
jgi:predicted enzyme related to lactoylglutathione lyase